MITVWKYALKIITTPQQVIMPKGAKLILVASQTSTVVLWAQVESTAATETRTYTLVPTGGAVPTGTTHVGSTIVGNPSYTYDQVFHVYETNRAA